jgi:hypothetical protein
LKPGINFEKVKIQKVPWFRVPLRMVSVAWKLSAIEDQVVCLDEKITKTKATIPKRKNVLGSSSSKDVFRSLEDKQDKRIKRKQRFYFQPGHYWDKGFLQNICPGFESR